MPKLNFEHKTEKIENFPNTDMDQWKKKEQMVNIQINIQNKAGNKTEDSSISTQRDSNRSKQRRGASDLVILQQKKLLLE